MENKDRTSELNTTLERFLENNPTSSVHFDEDEEIYVIHKPWGDESLEIAIGENDEMIISVLNDILLPERYSAIYHRQKRILEFAYTVFPPSAGKDIRDRRFNFIHKNVQRTCRFHRTSDELLHVARHIRPTEGGGSSGYRNMLGYSTFILHKEGQIKLPDEMASVYNDAYPLSFFIDDVDWDDDQIVDLVYHLNFYMLYYDRESPLIVVHAPADERRKPSPQTRFPFSSFPDTIKSNEIDRNLLEFWRASREGDPARRFIYNFQILEYCSFYMIEDEISRSILTLLSSPDAMSRAHDVAAQLFEAFGASKLQDAQKMDLLVKKTVNPEVVWRAIDQNRNALCRQTNFDGGFSAPPLISEKTSFDDFKTHWPNSFVSKLRSIRNALSHGREQRMTSVITPTARNMRALQPWVPVIAATAAEAMVYRNVR